LFLLLVGRIEHGDEGKSQKMSGWVSSIAELHRAKPPSVVHYAKRMPDLEGLMQEWPPEMEAALRAAALPSGDLVRMAVCGGWVGGWVGGGWHA
jgi:hypothetical protein